MGTAAVITESDGINLFDGVKLAEGKASNLPLMDWPFVGGVKNCGDWNLT